MPGIYIAAILTIALAVILVSVVILKRMPPADRLLAALSVAASAVAFFGAYYLLRLPLDNIVQPLSQGSAAWYRFATTFYAPLTEEPAKWAVLIPLFLAGKIRHDNAGAWAICLGFGFGMGEIAFLAQRIAADPQTLTMPWYQSSGFIIERLMVCTIHSGLVLVAAGALAGRKPWRLLVPIGLHWLVNIPIYLSYRYPLDAAGIVWGQLLWTWVTLCFVGALIYVGQSILTPAQRLAALLGKAVCPECQTLYVRPWLGVNRIGKRYERCPQCKHSHWTTRYIENARQ
jgi:uncharacterized membrane protein YhfC